VGDFDEAARQYESYLATSKTGLLLRYRTLYQLVLTYKSMGREADAKRCLVTLRGILSRASVLASEYKEYKTYEALERIREDEDRDSLILSRLIPADETMESLDALELASFRQQISLERNKTFVYGVYSTMYRYEARAYAANPLKISRLHGIARSWVPESHRTFFGEFGDIDCLFVVKEEGLAYAITPNSARERLPVKSLKACLDRLSEALSEDRYR
jgi:hypothetical protein